MRIFCANRKRILAGVQVVAATALFVPTAAHAHDVLNFPPPWVVEDALGDPQKVAPCGVDSTVSYTPSNIVTTFAPGQTITLKWQETIAHDGWFRIALSYANRADLKDPPSSPSSIPAPTTQTAALLLGNSTDAGIEKSPVAPVLIDGLYPHTAAGISTPKTYTYDLKLPDKTCTKCTLQLVQFMNNHPYNFPGGFFYHHCADISIKAGADGGTSSNGGDAGVVSLVDASGGGSSGTGSASGDSSGSASSSGGEEGGTASGAGGSGDAAGSGAPSEGSSTGGCLVSSRPASALAGIGGLIGLVGLLGRRRRR